MKFRRRTYITNAGLQMKITLIFLAVSMLGSLVSTFVFNFFALREFEKLMWSTHISVKDTGEIIGPLFVYVNIGNFLFVSVMLILAVIWMMKIKSGPIYRMNKDMKKIAEGDLSTRILLRKKDEFQEVADELNEMTEKIGEKFGVVKDKYAYVSKFISRLKMTDNDPVDDDADYKTVLKNIDGIEQELKKFQV